MSLTLRGLVRDDGLGLRVHAGAAELDRRVTWVHGTELADPTPFLEGGELLLTTGLGLPRGTDRREYVRRLAEVGAAGLGFGTGLSHDTVPCDLVDAAREMRLPLLEVPRRTPFLAISKAVSKAIAADEYAAVARMNEAQRELTRAAISSAGSASLVRRLAHLVDGWVLLLDPTGSPLRAEPDSAQRYAEKLRPEVDRLSAMGGLASAAFEVAEHEVFVQVLGSRMRGFLAVGRAESLGSVERHIVNTAASLLTLAMEQSRMLDSAHSHLRNGLFHLLAAGQTAVVRDSASQLWGPLPEAPLRVLALGGPESTRQRALDLVAVEAAKLAEPVFFAEVDPYVVVLAGAEGELSGSLVRLVERLPGLRVGLSEPVNYSATAEGHRQSTQAAEAALRGGGSVVRFAELAGSGLLSLLPDDVASAFAESLLAPLREHDAGGRGDLVDSLRMWLRQHGQWDPAAARLGVHRHTLRNRMRRVEELTGRSLDSPGFRAELWLALQVSEAPAP
jgi:purine catabolism regulator